MANSVEWNTWAIDFLQMLVHTDTLKMLSRLHIGRTNSVCDLCSCSCLDTRIHRHTHTWWISAAHVTNRRASRWKLCTADVDMLVCICVFHHHQPATITMMIIFFRVCLFVSFHHRCCFSLIYSQWESLMELWLDRIGLDWIGLSLNLDFVFLIQFLVFLVRLFCSFVCSVPYCRFTEFSFGIHTSIIFANWSIIKWLIKIFAFFSKFLGSIKTNRTN